MNGTLTPQTQQYLDAVRAHLADVPQQEREDLLEDLEQHLAEVAAEAEGPLEDRLGPPAEYAAELRASAGLNGGRRQSRLRTVAGVQLQRLSALPRHDRLHGLRTLAEELRPGWWVLRGYLLVVGWQLLLDSRNHKALPIPRPADSAVLGLILVALAVAGSVWIGRRPQGATRVAAGILSVLGVMSAFTAVVMVNTTLRGVQDLYVDGSGVICDGGNCFEAGGYLEEPVQADLLSRDGRPITNIYAYGEDGALLRNVRLYDQRGKPISILRETTPYGRPVVTSYPVDLQGSPVTNAFPQQQAVQGPSDSRPIEPPALDVQPLRVSTPESEAPTAREERRAPPRQQRNDPRP